MEDPNKSAKEAFQKMLENGQVSASAYTPSSLHLQRIVLRLQKENNELRKQIEELETRIKETNSTDTK